MSKAAGKTFDAVDVMRSARAAISSQIAPMTVDQENEWLRSRPPSDPTLLRLFKLAAQQGAGAGGVQHRIHDGQ